MSPVRIQRRRVKGWRQPLTAVYVGRPTKWGNRFRVGDLLAFPYLHSALGTGEPGDCVHDQQHAVDLFRAYTQITPFYEDWARGELAGKDLCCWCALDQPCHADVLLEIANGGAA